MEESNVSIEVAIKIVGENHFEFSTAYGAPVPESGHNPHVAPQHVQIVHGTSSLIGPGLSKPVA
jgi:hypothetical protein